MPPRRCNGRGLDTERQQTMSTSEDSSVDPAADLVAYRDKMAAVEPSTYHGAYMDGLNMAIFLVRAAMHRENLSQLALTVLQ